MRSSRRWAAAILAVASVFIPALTQAQTESEDNLGGAGETCRARSDCKHGLKCISSVCVDEHAGETCGATSECGTLKCIDHRCVNPLTAPPPSVQPPPSASARSATAVVEEQPAPPGLLAPPRPSHALEDWLRFDRAGVHGFAGLTVAGGFINGGYTGSQGALWGSGVDGAFLFALRGGVVIGRHELALEIAPYTYLWDLSVGKGPEFEVNASYAYFVPLLVRPKASLSWPLRGGLGVVAGGNDASGGNVFFEARADLIGLAMTIGHVSLELHAPSFRYALTNGHVDGIAVEGVTTHWLSFLFGTSASYVF